MKVSFITISVQLALVSCTREAAPTTNNGEYIKSFAAFDLNGDSFISINEWEYTVNRATAQLRDAPAAEVYRKELVRLFSRLDTNTDRRIDAREWQTGRFEIGDLP